MAVPPNSNRQHGGVPLPRRPSKSPPRQSLSHLPARPVVNQDQQQSHCQEQMYHSGADNGVRETSNREELIQCIKRGEYPTWVPPKVVEDHTPATPRPTEHDVVTSRFRELLPAVDIQETTVVTPTELAPASEIERPRSALHSGDFRDESPERRFSYRFPPFRNEASDHVYEAPSQTSPPLTWLGPLTPPRLRRLETDPITETGPQPTMLTRSRAPSLGSSLSSSFVYRPPTSPLVHAASNTDIDFSDPPLRQPPFNDSSKSGRRRTLPPESFHPFQPPAEDPRAMSYSRPFPYVRRDYSLPYQAHQPQRSLNASSFHASPWSVTPPRTSRRPSFSDVSPIQHASMVGSYEESILRGRMSTTPSKPLDFIAEIGVLGKGDCMPSLRCPAHVSIPFPAVFYSYNSGSPNHHIDDSPSPYVGNIDLEHNLKPVAPKEKRHSHHVRQSPDGQEPVLRDIAAPENTPIGIQLERRKREKRRRRSQSPKAPVGGCYRIPQQGQIQIIIKNPNKTAVKLYLIPYDLEGMEAGTKTFIRQRSYSTGPIIDLPVPGSVQPGPTANEKPTLRYLIHLRICCPSKDRFYLYDNIRVVFANRVPDGKERLRNEIQLPEPRYSTWKLNREPSGMGSAGAKLAADKAFRRRSSGFGITPFGYGDIDGLGAFETVTVLQRRPGPPLPVPRIPFSFIPPAKLEGDSGTFDHDRSPTLQAENLRPTSRGSTSSPAPPIVSGFTLGSPVTSIPNDMSGSESGESGAGGPYTKLQRQEGGYGSTERFQGLLAQRLKGRDVQRSPESDGKLAKDMSGSSDQLDAEGNTTMGDT